MVAETEAEAAEEPVALAFVPEDPVALYLAEKYISIFNNLKWSNKSHEMTEPAVVGPALVTISWPIQVVFAEERDLDKKVKTMEQTHFQK